MIQGICEILVDGIIEAGVCHYGPFLCRFYDCRDACIIKIRGSREERVLDLKRDKAYIFPLYAFVKGETIYSKRVDIG